jgi:hypothetical protein
MLELLTHVRMTLYQETKSTPEHYRALSSEPQISENFIHRIYGGKKFFARDMFTFTVYINVQILKTKQCSNKTSDLCTPKQKN